LQAFAAQILDVPDFCLMGFSVFALSAAINLTSIEEGRAAAERPRRPDPRLWFSGWRDHIRTILLRSGQVLAEPPGDEIPRGAG